MSKGGFFLGDLGILHLLAELGEEVPQVLGRNHARLLAVEDLRTTRCSWLGSVSILSAPNGISSTLNGIISTLNGIISTLNGISSTLNGIISTLNGIISTLNGIISAVGCVIELL